ncbi:MAG: hypothetical protein ACW98X_23540 [Promethearchaeota archaeon]
MILFDLKTKVFYTECHIKKEELIKLKDDDATIDPEYQEEYRLNRTLQPTNPDFLIMKEDAAKGRQFSDIVIEYNKEYREENPLKILGGQHRAKAIEGNSPEYTPHGIRVYFNLNKDQRAEIARISNTNINIADDLLDRMEEQRLDPPNKLRNFAQKIGLLKSGQDFGDKKTSKEDLPTIRLMRTFIVNFYAGKNYKSEFDNEAPEAYLCNSGGMDPEYLKIFKNISDFTSENDLLEAGKQFVKLHNEQYEIASKNTKLKRFKAFKMKAVALAVVSSWAFTCGLLQRYSDRLRKLYDLPKKSYKQDPLNAIQMSEYKLRGTDLVTYRGIGTRSDSKERGRLIMIFLEYSKKESKDYIDQALLERAVRFYHSNKMRIEGDKFK